MAEENNIQKKRVYCCAFYEYEYDGFGKYGWCHCQDNPERECFIETSICADLCPFFKRADTDKYVDEDIETCRKIRDRYIEEFKRKADRMIETSIRELAAANKQLKFAELLKQKCESEIERNIQ